jgi:hypothetical protein
MDLVLRPVNDRFFHEQVLSFLSLAMSDSAGAVQTLLGQLDDDESRLLGGKLLASHIGGGLGGVEQVPWVALVDRLTQLQWEPGPSGWRVLGERAGYVGDWDEALHLALMLEDPSYPYTEARASHGRREGFRRYPVADLGLASLIGGQWEPFPAFPPDRVFSTRGRGEYASRQQYAFADWAWRPASTVVQWSAQLESKLLRLLERERERLKPAEPPELEAVRSFFLGHSSECPELPEILVGSRGGSWAQRIGALAALVREAAREEAGLVAHVMRPLNEKPAEPPSGESPAGA